MVPIGARPSGEWRYSARHRILSHGHPGWCYPTGRCAYLPSVTRYRQSINLLLLLSLSPSLPPSLRVSKSTGRPNSVRRPIRGLAVPSIPSIRTILNTIIYTSERTECVLYYRMRSLVIECVLLLLHTGYPIRLKGRPLRQL